MLEREALEQGRTFVKPELAKAKAGSAYRSVRDRINKTTQDPLKTGESLAVDLLHEKSHELSRFAEKVATPKDELLEGNLLNPSNEDEQDVRSRISALMNKYASNQPDKFHMNESVDKSGRRVRRPKLMEPRTL